MLLDAKFHLEHRAARKRQLACAPTGKTINESVYPLDQEELGAKAACIVIGNDMWAHTNHSENDLRFSQFVDCNMNYADFSGADLTNAHFLRCNIAGINFSGCIGLTWASFEECTLDCNTKMPFDMPKRKQ